MSKTSILFIGLDTHKEFCHVAYCEDSRESVPMSFGRISTTKQAITKFARQMSSNYPAATLYFVYEAGLRNEGNERS